jgi:hypothetical protein
MNMLELLLFIVLGLFGFGLPIALTILELLP